MALKIGDLLASRYEIIRPIRSGAMGSVYEVGDRNVNGKIRAAKEILDKALEGPHRDYVRSKFELEMRSLAALSHPGIPQVVDFFQVGEASYIVMDFIQGANLEDELRARMCEHNVPFEPEQVVDDLLEALDILAYLHAQEPPVLHRDIKPSNIIRNAKTKRLVLVDFGLARSHQEGEQQTRVGTPGYCSGEQMAGKAEPRSDLYSLGVTAYHLLCGKAPRMLTCDPQVEVMPGFDPDLSAIIERATQFKVKDRYPDAASMIADLNVWKQKQERLRATLVPAVGGGPWRTAAGGLGMLAVLVTGVWLGSSRLAGMEVPAGTGPSGLPVTVIDENSPTPIPLPPESRPRPTPRRHLPSNDDYVSNVHRLHRPEPESHHEKRPEHHDQRLRPAAPLHDEGLDFTHLGDGTRLPLATLATVSAAPNFHVVLEEHDAYLDWVGSGPRRQIAASAQFYHQSPRMALEGMIRRSHPLEADPPRWQGENLVNVVYHGPTKIGFYVFHALPYKGGTIVYACEGTVFRIGKIPKRIMNELQAAAGHVAFNMAPSL